MDRMEDKGSFRTSLNGFHKKDVLDYIDSLQSQFQQELEAQMQELQSVRSEYAQVKEQVDALQRDKEEAQSLQAEAETLSRQMQQQLDDMKRTVGNMQLQVAAVEDLRRENRRLHEKEEMLTKEMEDQTRRQHHEIESAYTGRLNAMQAERDRLAVESESLRADMVQLKEAAVQKDNGQKQLAEQLLASRKEASAWQEKAEKYESLLGDVGGFIVEIRAMGQRFLETSYKRSECCLDALDDAVAALERQMAENRSDVEMARQELLDNSTAAGLRMEELVQALEDAAAEIPDKTNECKPNRLEEPPAPVKKDKVEKADSHFFRWAAGRRQN